MTALMRHVNCLFCGAAGEDKPSDALEKPALRWDFCYFSSILLAVEFHRVTSALQLLFPSKESYAPEHETGRHRCGRRPGRLR